MIARRFVGALVGAGILIAVLLSPNLLSRTPAAFDTPSARAVHGQGAPAMYTIGDIGVLEAIRLFAGRAVPVTRNLQLTRSDRLRPPLRSDAWRAYLDRTVASGLERRAHMRGERKVPPA